MNAKLQAIAQKAGSNLTQLIIDAEEQTLAAWDAAVQDAQDNETKPKLTLGCSVKLDLDADHMETKLSVSTKHTFSCDDPIPDPDQMTLPVEVELSNVLKAKLEKA